MDMSYVCFNISSECNMHCPYCYRVGNTRGNVSLESAKRYVDYLVKHGCKTINVTGGEPLLNCEWKNIIKYCADNGLFVILSTNGLQLDLHDEILNQVAVLSLPLDGGTSEVNSKTRSEGHFIKIRKLIDEYIEGHYQFRLKINTVLTGYNFDKLNEILMILNDPKIVWKIFELREKGEYYQFPDDKVLSNEKAKQSMLTLNKIQHKCSIYFMGKKSDELQEYNVKPNYIVLDYNGDIYFADEKENRLLFNIENSTITKRVDFGETDLLNNQYNEELRDAIK